MRLAFNAFVLANVTNGADIVKQVDWDAWVKQPGANPPGNGLNFTTDDAVFFAGLADYYIDNEQTPPNIDRYLKETDPQLKTVFHNQLVTRQYEVTYDVLALIDKDVNATGEKNPEIGQRWFPLCIAIDYEPCFAAAESYVSRIGRQKYIIPVYQSLAKNGYKNLAYKWYRENMTWYHPITSNRIKKIILSTVEYNELMRLSNDFKKQQELLIARGDVQSEFKFLN